MIVEICSWMPLWLDSRNEMLSVYRKVCYFAVEYCVCLYICSWLKVKIWDASVYHVFTADELCLHRIWYDFCLVCNICKSGN